MLASKRSREACGPRGLFSCIFKNTFLLNSFVYLKIVMMTVPPKLTEVSERGSNRADTKDTLWISGVCRPGIAATMRHNWRTIVKKSVVSIVSNDLPSARRGEYRLAALARAETAMKLPVR